MIYIVLYQHDTTQASSTPQPVIQSSSAVGGGGHSGFPHTPHREAPAHSQKGNCTQQFSSPSFTGAEQPQLS